MCKIIMPVARLVLVLTAALQVAGHALVTRFGSAQNPYHLGDATRDSWAACGVAEARAVAHYSFDASAAGGEDLWLGVYTPGCEALAADTRCPDRSTALSVALWGMPPGTRCAPWPGWGDVAAVPATTPLPARVQLPVPGDTYIVLSAPGEPPQRPVFEPFTPTAFTPRSTCVAPLGNVTTMRMALWADSGDGRPMRWCIGIGRTEASVYSPIAVLGASFGALWLHLWNRWHPGLVMVPLWLPATLVLGTRGRIFSEPGEISCAVLQFVAVSIALQGAVSVAVLTWSVAASEAVSVGAWGGSLVLNSVAPVFVARLVYSTAAKPLTHRAKRWLLLYGATFAVLGVGYALGPIVVVLIGGSRSLPAPVRGAPEAPTVTQARARAQAP